MPLSDLQIRKVKPKDKPFRLGDGLGLHLMVKPQQNAYIERYNRTVRHEQPPLGDCMQSPAGQWGQNIFETIEEAQEQATNWLWTYNNDRPNMGIGGTTPAMKLKQAA